MPPESRVDVYFPPTAALIRDALSSILSSREFAKASELRALLSTLIGSYFDDRESRAGDFTAAINLALASTATKNPEAEARRLKWALERYYSGSGRSERLIIEVTEASLVPRIRWRDQV